MSSNRGGFTIIELLIAMIILTVGLLAMLGSSALDTRAIARQRNVDLASIYAARRLDVLRISACRAAANGSETLMRGADTLSVNTWRFTATTDVLTGLVDGYGIQLLSNYRTDANRRRTDTLQTGISCARY